MPKKGKRKKREKDIPSIDDATQPPLDGEVITNQQAGAIYLAMVALGNAGNPFAAGLVSLMKGKTLPEKRRIIAGSFAQGFAFCQAVLLYAQTPDAELVDVAQALARLAERARAEVERKQIQNEMPRIIRIQGRQN